VALEPVQANFLRVGELSAEVGESKAAAAAFKRVAQLTAESGGEPAQWFERAYQETRRMRRSRWNTGRACWGRDRLGGDFYSGAAGDAGKTSPVCAI